MIHVVEFGVSQASLVRVPDLVESSCGEFNLFRKRKSMCSVRSSRRERSCILDKNSHLCHGDTRGCRTSLLEQPIDAVNSFFHLGQPIDDCFLFFQMIFYFFQTVFMFLQLEQPMAVTDSFFLRMFFLFPDHFLPFHVISC